MPSPRIPTSPVKIPAPVRRYSPVPLSASPVKKSSSTAARDAFARRSLLFDQGASTGGEAVVAGDAQKAKAPRGLKAGTAANSQATKATKAITPKKPAKVVKQPPAPSPAAAAAVDAADDNKYENFVDVEAAESPSKSAISSSPPQSPIKPARPQATPKTTPRKGRAVLVPSSVRRPLVRASSKKCWEVTSPHVGYQRWRLMQYELNWRMVVLLRSVARMSLLPLSGGDVLLEGSTVEEIADRDPNPDADVKFMGDGTYRVAPASILRELMPKQGGGGGSGGATAAASTAATTTTTINDDGDADENGKPRKPMPWCVLIGSPGHISIGILWPAGNVTTTTTTPKAKTKAKSKAKTKAKTTINAKTTTAATAAETPVAGGPFAGGRLEHFDSRGINESIKAGGGSYLSLPHIRQYFKQQHSVATLRSVNYVDFQEVELDVYCQTWIFYFVYMRLVHKHSANKVVQCIDALSNADKLVEVKRFQHWLLNELPINRNNNSSSSNDNNHWAELGVAAAAASSPASMEEVLACTISDDDRVAFRLPYKAPPSALRKLALSPQTEDDIMMQVAASRRRPAGAFVRACACLCASVPVCVCVCAFMRVCRCACLRACRACVCVRGRVHACLRAYGGIFRVAWGSGVVARGAGGWGWGEVREIEGNVGNHCVKRMQACDTTLHCHHLTHTQTHTHTHTPTQTQTRTHKHIHRHTQTHTHARMHTHTAHTQTDTDTHSQ
jgi:hypothetical protein